MSALAQLTDEEALVAGVAVFVRGRNLHENPPKDDETLVVIGVGPTNLNVPIRGWINAKFRKSKAPPLPLLRSGDLTVGMTWAKFRKAALE